MKVYQLVCVEFFLFFLTPTIEAQVARHERSESGEETRSGSKKEELHLCYFSLNHEKEFTVMEKWSKAHNQNLRDKKIIVHEYQNKGKSPEENFVAMMNEHMQKGISCDGLVISGHHTGSFFGSRDDSNKGLSIEMLEKLSCDPQYAEWFNKVNALWLQGCRTLGANIVAGNANAVNADFHTDRVFNVREEDNLNFSYTQLSQMFSEALDQSNPLSSRYMRTFPRASVFGWTATAPGEKARSEMSLPYFIANLAKVKNDSAPISVPTLSKSHPSHTQALVALLQKIELPNYQQGKLEKQAILAWLAHGQREKLKGLASNPSSFQNRDLNAVPAMYSSDPKELLPMQQTQVLTCALKNYTSPEDPIQVIKILEKKPNLIPFLINSIVSFLANDSPMDASSRDRVREILKHHQPILNFINERLTSDQVGVLKKVDFLTMLEEIEGKKNTAGRAKIIDSVKRLFTMKAKSNADGTLHSDTRMARSETVDSLLKIDALTPELATELASNDKRYAALIAEKLRPSKQNLKILSVLFDVTEDPQEIKNLNSHVNYLLHDLDLTKMRIEKATHRDFNAFLQHPKISNEMKAMHRALRGVRDSAGPVELRTVPSILETDLKNHDRNQEIMRRYFQNPGVTSYEKAELRSKLYDHMPIEEKMIEATERGIDTELYLSELQKIESEWHMTSLNTTYLKNNAYLKSTCSVLGWALTQAPRALKNMVSGS